jgi:hypothetical protein
MTLSKTDTQLLNTALACEANLFYWMKNDTITISANSYSEIRAEFQAWKELYEDGELYGTFPNNDTFQFSGITQFPIPPSR